MKETAKFIGDLAWFSASKTRGRYSSPREALKAHLDYILRPEECVVSWNLRKEDWLRRADSLLERSTRSRVAAKQVYALPNDLSPSEGLALLREFLTSRKIFFYKQRVDGETKRVPVKLDDSDFGVAVHDSRGISGVRNLHAHILFSPVVKGGKIDANKSSLSRLHREWESFLKSKGYTLRRSPVPEGHYGPSRLRYDRKARASYAHLVRGKQLWREALERERMRRMIRQALQQSGDNLLSWDEIMKEDAPTRGEKKGESPPPRPVKQAKPVVNPRQPRSVQQPRLRVGLQRPSQRVEETEATSKDPVKRIQKEMEKELEQKKKRERQFAQELDYSLKQQARELSRSESPPPQQPESYPKQKERMEVGNVQNPFVTTEVIEERREQEKEQQLKQAQVYQAEMRITYRYRYVKGELTFRFRVRASWSAKKRKGIAAFLASVAVAVLYGYKFPKEALSFFGSFVERETVAVKEQVKRVIKKPFYSNPEEALRALSVRKTIHVRVRVFENGRLVEEHNFFLTRESFTVFEKYAETVRRRRPPEPGGQQPGQGQPLQGEPPEPDEEEPDWPAPGM